MISDADEERAARYPDCLLLGLADGLWGFGYVLAIVLLLAAQTESRATESRRLFAEGVLAVAMPVILLAPIAGVLADRVCRRWLMGAGFLAGAGTMVLAASWGAGSPTCSAESPFVSLVLLASVAAVYLPAHSAYLPTLVGRRRISRVKAMLSAVDAFAAAMATTIGLRLVPQQSAQRCLYADAAALACGALLLLFIRPVCRGTVLSIPKAVRRRTLWAGLAYLICHRRVLVLIATAAAAAMLGGVVIGTGLLSFHEPSGGIRMALPPVVVLFALGAGATSCLLALFGDALRFETAVTWSLLAIGVIGLVWGARLPVSDTTRASMAALIAVTGACTTATILSCGALLQRLVPGYLGGRAHGDYISIVGFGAMGGFGLVLKFHGSRLAIWVLPAAAMIALGLGVGVFLDRRRRSPFGLVQDFWRHLNEFYCRWWFRLERVGPCTIPRDGAVIVAANHTCTIDPLLLIATNPRCYIGFLIAKEYHELPLVGRFTRMVDCIPVKRDGYDVAGTLAALRYLRSGRVLGVFPQGRIPKPNEVVGPKPGIALLALAMRVPVVPVNISGTRYSDSPAWPFFRRHRARVRYGKPMDLSRYHGRHRDPAALEEVARLIMLRIEELAPGRKSDESP